MAVGGRRAIVGDDMLRNAAAVLAVLVVAALVCGLAADAAPRQRQRSQSSSDQPPSLDGRTLGYPRTCGHDYYVYSGTGTPVGPYCH
jgi:hypothetical protein